MQAKPYLSGRSGQRRSGGDHQRGAKRHRLRRYLHPAQSAGLGVFSQVVVKTLYEDKDRGVQLKKYSRVIKENNPPVPFIYPIGTNVEKAALLFGRLLYAGRRQPDLPPTGRESNPQLPGYGETRGNQILIANALPKQQKYTIIFKPSQKTFR